MVAVNWPGRSRRLVRGNPSRVGGKRKWLDRKARAALGAATAKYGPTTFALHACAKPVGALALDNTRLISAFHNCLLSAYRM